MRNVLRSLCLAGALVCLAAPAAGAGVLLEPHAAPEWKCSEWLNGNPGTLASNRGKVVVIHFFQMWCPVCNQFSIPLLESWERKYAERKDVLLVSVHSVFEGYEAQTPELLKVFVADKGIHHPVCIDAYPQPGAETPITMDAYQTEGTPHLAIVDKVGNLRFSHFGRFDPAPVEFFINRLVDDKGTTTGKIGARTSEAKPGPRAGKTSRATPPATQAPAAPAGPSPYSGTYKLTIEQLSKSCGAVLPPMEVIAEVTAADNTVEARFTRPLLGLTQLKADFDPVTRQFQVDLLDKAKDKDVAIDVNLSLHGAFLDGAPEPTVEFQFSFGMRGQDGAADCAVDGRGEGTRLRAR